MVDSRGKGRCRNVGLFLCHRNNKRRFADDVPHGRSGFGWPGNSVEQMRQVMYVDVIPARSRGKDSKDTSRKIPSTLQSFRKWGWHKTIPRRSDGIPAPVAGCLAEDGSRVRGQLLIHRTPGSFSQSTKDNPSALSLEPVHDLSPFA